MELGLRKRAVIVVFFIFSIFILIGCGGGGEDDVVVDNNFIYARFNKIADATVKIYELERNGSKTLLFTQKSKNDKNFKETGRFYSRLSSLEADKFYIYEVNGGIDKDENNDGREDENVTKNRGKARLIVKGEWIENYPEALNLTIASEILYLYVHKYFFKQSELENVILSLPSKILTEDIDGDGNITINDIFAFDPLKDISKLNAKFRDKAEAILHKIHNNDKSYAKDIFNVRLASFFYEKNIENSYFSKEKNLFYLISRFYDEKGNYLEILGMDDRLNVKKKGEIYFGEDIKGAAFSKKGDRLFLYGDHFIKEIDISDKNKPLVMREKVLPNDVFITAFSLLDDKIAFIGIYNDNGAKLRVFDVNGFYTLKETDFSSTNNFKISKIFISSFKDIIFVLYDTYPLNTLNIFNISDLNNIYFLSSLEIPSLVTDIAESDDPYLLFVESFETNRDLIEVFDLTTLASPVSIGKFETFFSLGSYESKLYFEKREKKLYSFTPSGIRIFDVFNPNDPKLIGYLKLVERPDGEKISNFFFSKDEKNIFIVKNFSDFYEGKYKSALEIIDNRFDFFPSVLKTYFMEGEISDFTVSKDEKRGYVLKRNCNKFTGGYFTLFSVYDISDLFSFKLLGDYKSEEYVCGERILITEDGTKAGLYEDFYYKFITLDLTNENDPCLLNVFDTKDNSNYPYFYSEDKSRAYKGDPKNKDVEIYDVTRPFAPKFLYKFEKEAKKDIESKSIKFKIDFDKIEVVDEGLFE